MVNLMAKRTALFIVEGLSDEVKFVKKLLEKCNRNLDYKVFCYKTNIHVLAKELEDNYPDFDDEDEYIDFRLVLVGLADNEKDKNILSQNYNDIFLIFDFEPQEINPHFDVISIMLKYFNDSTEHGKLYINYPMMQSYKDFSYLPDDDFLDKKLYFNDG